MSAGKFVATENHTVNRRVAIFASLSAASVVLWPKRTWARPTEEISHSEESIHQETILTAGRKRIYDALLDAKQFDKVTQLSAEMRAGKSYGSKVTEIDREVGGAFTLFGGHIVGRNIELVPNERIVQAWRVVDWEPGHYSIAKFELVEHGSGSTKIVFDHTGFPKGQAEHLAEGWKGHYWETLEKYLA
ncbi:MAG: SRPBCC domain-containing protein [Acidobacteriota bacterium]|nr:SRPBCC domain-containing protein [Acidobacteriota bacterium]